MLSLKKLLPGFLRKLLGDTHQRNETVNQGKKIRGPRLEDLKEIPWGRGLYCKNQVTV
jgi:hypothetical protein